VLTFGSRYRIAADSATDEACPVPCVFLAEDNPGDVELLRLALEENQVACELFVACDGETALAFIDEIGAESMVCPALAILDFNLPKRNGREVLQHIRDCPACDNIPVVILSSSGSPKHMAETAELGAIEYIRKPTSLEGFLQIGGMLKRFIVGPK
jgi:DNA-binding response OmpR family regulator